METYKCECGQTSFAPLISYNRKEICTTCYHNILLQYSTLEGLEGMILKVISLNYNQNPIYLPLQENLIKEDCKTFLELKNKWEKEKWFYRYNVKVELVNVISEEIELKDPSDVSECEELENIQCFTELTFKASLYSTPWDSVPSNMIFSSELAYDAYKGEIYSKDFSYFYCDCCGRTICEQYPSLIKIDVEGLEKQVLESGIPKEAFEDGSWESYLIFEDDSTMKEAGFVYNSSNSNIGVYSKSDMKNIERICLEKIAEGNDIYVSIESMAYGGSEGYVTIWEKCKKEELV